MTILSGQRIVRVGRLDGRFLMQGEIDLHGLLGRMLYELPFTGPISCTFGYYNNFAMHPLQDCLETGTKKNHSKVLGMWTLWASISICFVCKVSSAWILYKKIKRTLHCKKFYVDNSSKIRRPTSYVHRNVNRLEAASMYGQLSVCHISARKLKLAPSMILVLHHSRHHFANSLSLTSLHSSPAWTTE